MHLIHRRTCRVCKSNALTKVIHLGDQYLQGSFVKEGLPLPPQRKITLSLVRCDPMLDESACGLLQMEHTVPPEVLYSSYWYRSGTNETMRNHLAGIVESATKMHTGSISNVLDIGCNDGTLLRCYSSKINRYGVDPSDVAQQSRGDLTVIQDIFPSKELVKLMGENRFDIITSIAMFYDLEDPIEFSRGIKALLKSDGLWVFEMSYMPTMLKMNSYDTICHEHLEYYSLAVVETILKKVGLQLVNVSLNDINGGSIRCYATHENFFGYKKESYLQNIKTLRREEFDLELDTDKPYRNFQDRINVHKDELVALLKKLKKEGKKIHVYGASTKGNTILQWCGLDHKIIDVAAERNPEKYGAKTLGTDIPIVSEEDSRSQNPDYYLVLPWHFRAEILKRESEALKRGIKFIFPLPTIEIVEGKSK